MRLTLQVIGVISKGCRYGKRGRVRLGEGKAVERGEGRRNMRDKKVKGSYQKGNVGASE